MDERLIASSTRAESILFVLMSADLGLSAYFDDAQGLPAALIFFALANIYDLANSVLVATRDKHGIPSGIAWIAGQPAGGTTVEDALTHNQGGIVSVTANELIGEATGRQRKVSPVGGSAAGGLLVVMLSYAGLAYASSAVVAPQLGAAPETGHVHSPGGATPPSRKRAATYDEICGPTPTEPGSGAPDWASGPLYRLWLGPDEGVGGNLAGCAQTAKSVVGHPEAVYQVGLLNREVVGVAVSIHYGPSTIYLGAAADRVLTKLRQGIVVIGPNGAHIAAAQLIMVPLSGGKIYVPPGT
jgi:hypothetical protein